MTELTEIQIKRQDFVDNRIFELIRDIAPSHLKLDWNIEMIAAVREAIRHCLADYLQFDEQNFYPFIEE